MTVRTAYARRPPTVIPAKAGMMPSTAPWLRATTVIPAKAGIQWALSEHGWVCPRTPETPRQRPDQRPAVSAGPRRFDARDRRRVPTFLFGAAFRCVDLLLQLPNPEFQRLELFAGPGEPPRSARRTPRAPPGPSGRFPAAMTARMLRVTSSRTSSRPGRQARLDAAGEVVELSRIDHLRHLLDGDAPGAWRPRSRYGAKSNFEAQALRSDRCSARNRSVNSAFVIRRRRKNGSGRASGGAVGGTGPGLQSRIAEAAPTPFPDSNRTPPMPDRLRGDGPPPSLTASHRSSTGGSRPRPVSPSHTTRCTSSRAASARPSNASARKAAADST